MRSKTIRCPHSSSLPAIILLAAASMLAGCVTPIPLAKEAPDVSYKSTVPTVVSVTDQRDLLAEGKPPTFIGVAHAIFGIPADIQTYPGLVSDKEKKDQTLAQALQERIVVGLNDEGWQLSGTALAKPPTREEAVSILAAQSAQRLLVLSLTQWYVSINLNWVNAFNFDWGYQLEVFDTQGAVVASIADSGRDVVDEKASESPQNMIKMAFRDRLIKILERPEVRTALEQ
jgi:hypothetical protein